MGQPDPHDGPIPIHIRWSPATSAWSSTPKARTARPNRSCPQGNLPKSPLDPLPPFAGPEGGWLAVNGVAPPVDLPAIPSEGAGNGASGSRRRSPPGDPPADRLPGRRHPRLRRMRHLPPPRHRTLLLPPLPLPPPSATPRLPRRQNQMVPAGRGAPPKRSCRTRSRPRRELLLRGPPPSPPPSFVLHLALGDL